MTEAIPFGSCCHARSGHALSLNWKEKTSSSQHGATNGHQPTVFSLAPASPILTPLLNAFKRFLFSRAMARNGNMFFPRASERRVLPIVGVCISSSHLHILSSSHLLILTSPHLHIFSSSHLFDEERIAAADGMCSLRFTRHPAIFHLGICSALSEIDQKGACSYLTVMKKGASGNA